MDIQSLSPNTENNELQWLIARIQSRHPRQALPTPKPASVAAVIAHLRDEKPLTARELDECEREWAIVEAEQRAVEQADAYRDRLL